MIGSIFTKIDFLHKALDGTWTRNEAISNNIANVNTPGYKKVKVDFENILKNQLDNTKIFMNRTDTRHISGSGDVKNFSPLISEDRSTSIRRDGNNVNIDVEMGDLAKNTIMYNSLIKKLSGELEKIKSVISEGSK